jgi:hypothetical protein
MFRVVDFAVNAYTLAVAPTVLDRLKVAESSTTCLATVFQNNFAEGPPPASYQQEI